MSLNWTWPPFSVATRDCSLTCVERRQLCWRGGREEGEWRGVGRGGEGEVTVSSLLQKYTVDPNVLLCPLTWL